MTQLADMTDVRGLEQPRQTPFAEELHDLLVQAREMQDPNVRDRFVEEWKQDKASRDSK